MSQDRLLFWADDTRSKRAAILPADDGGAGDPPVVFLHSLAGRETQWQAELGHLRPSRRALALTLRGHVGAPSGGDFTIPVLAADVLRTLDVRGVGQFIAVAHSAGAAVAIQCAAAYPERVIGLVLVEAGGDARRFPAEEADAFIDALGSDRYQEVVEAHFGALLAGARPSVRDAVLADLRATPKDTVPAMLRALREFDPVLPLQRYDGPVLAVTSALGDGPYALHELVPRIRHLGIDGASHWLHMDKPDEFNRLLDEFIAEAKASSRLSE